MNDFDNIRKYQTREPRPQPPHYPLEKMVIRIKKVGGSTLGIALNPDVLIENVVDLDEYRRKQRKDIP